MVVHGHECRRRQLQIISPPLPSTAYPEDPVDWKGGADLLVADVEWRLDSILTAEAKKAARSITP